jgi:hypothetical protein
MSHVLAGALPTMLLLFGVLIASLAIAVVALLADTE